MAVIWRPFSALRKPPSAFPLSLPFLVRPLRSFLYVLSLRPPGATAGTGGGVRQVALSRHLLQGGARQGHQAQRGQDSGQAVSQSEAELELIRFIKSISLQVPTMIPSSSCVIFVKHFNCFGSSIQCRRYEVLQRGAKLFEFPAFLLPTNLGPPMHSPTAMTELHSPNLAGTFMLHTVHHFQHIN